MSNFVLNEGQEKTVQEAVHWFKNESSQVFEIAGFAGSGKSVVLHEIIDRLHLHLNEYMPMAYTGQASCVMRTKGFRHARSIHSSLYEFVKVEDNNTTDPFDRVNLKFNTKKIRWVFQPIPPGMLDPKIKLFVIDEAYMVPKFMMNDILQHGIKVLVAGDPGQLPPIGDEPGFLTGYGIHYLTEIMRQEANNPILYLATRARNGEPIHCGLYGNNALVIDEHELNMDMIMNVGNIVCGTNKTRDMFNNGIRKRLGYPDNPVYSDRVICRANNWNIVLDGIALANGLTGFITSPVSVDRFYSDKGIFEMDFLPDLLNRPFLKLNVNSEYFRAPLEVKNDMKKDRFVKGELFEYAYALTTHLAQGAEYPAGILIEEFLKPNIQDKLIYTGITRFKNYMIYVMKSRKYY